MFQSEELQKELQKDIDNFASQGADQLLACQQRLEATEQRLEDTQQSLAACQQRLDATNADRAAKEDQCR